MTASSILLLYHLWSPLKLDSCYYESACHRSIFAGAFLKLQCLHLTLGRRSQQQEIPSNTITQVEATEILQLDSANSSIRSKVFFYETLVDKYEHPFFMLRLANMLFILKSPTMAMQFCVKVFSFFLCSAPLELTYEKIKKITPLVSIKSLTKKGSTTCEERWRYRSTIR